MTAPLPPEERHDDLRPVLIDWALDKLPQWGLARTGSTDATLIAEKWVTSIERYLAAAGYQVVKVADFETRYGVQLASDPWYPNLVSPMAVDVPRGDVLALAAEHGGIAVQRLVSPWRPVGEDDTDAH